SPGSLGSHTLSFLRADSAFTNALAVFTASGKTDTQTTNFIRAARAGRASVRADLASWGLGPWSDATADAALVPDTSKFLLPYAAASPDQYNYLYWARANQSSRAHRVGDVLRRLLSHDEGCASEMGQHRDERRRRRGQIRGVGALLAGGEIRD